MEYNYKKIGERIQKLRKDHKISQEELSERLSIGRNKLSDIENGICDKISLRVLVELCDIFNCNIGYLLGEYLCRTKTASDIQKATGFDFEAADRVLCLKNDDHIAERKFIEDLLISSELHFLSMRYAEYKSIVSSEALAACGIEPDAMITILPTMENMRSRDFMALEADDQKSLALYRLTRAIQRFCERSDDEEVKNNGKHSGKKK